MSWSTEAPAAGEPATFPAAVVTRARRPSLARIAVAAPACLLLAIAATQMVLSRTVHLSPWKGGGFGMFAAIDGTSFREIRIFVQASARSEELVPPASLDALTISAAALPHASRLRALAVAVLDRERRRQRPVDTVRLEVWRTQISPTLESTAVKVCELTLRADDHVARADALVDRSREPRLVR